MPERATFSRLQVHETVVILLVEVYERTWKSLISKITESFFSKRILSYKSATVSDKNSWDTLTKRCFFPSRTPLVPLKVVYRGSVTKSCTPTLRGQGDPKVSQPF